MRRNCINLFGVIVCFFGCISSIAPAQSNPAKEKTARVSRSYPASGITTVILRALNADQARVTRDGTSNNVTVSGLPEGGAKGYHSAEPNWKETPAEEWGLGFQSKRYGKTLVISTSNEMAYIHHHYDLKDIEVSVPPGIGLINESRQLSGQGNPDLTEPKAK